VHGLYLEAATWDMDSMALQPALPGAMYASLPLIHLLPSSVQATASSGEQMGAADARYECPLYRTSVRAGVLTTTGASSNYVFDISLPIQKDSAWFVMQGTAALCALPE
jgi:dynein heavy chain